MVFKSLTLIITNYTPPPTTPPPRWKVITQTSESVTVRRNSGGCVTCVRLVIAFVIVLTRQTCQVRFLGFSGERLLDELRLKGCHMLVE